MVQLFFRLAVLAITALPLANPAFPAASKKNIADCAAKDPATIIKGCTAIFKETKGNFHGQAIALYNRSLAYTTLGKRDQAFADLNDAIALLKGHEEQEQKLAYNAYLERGRAYYSQKKYEEAKKDFEFATNLDRTDPKAAANLAFTLNDMEDFEGAEKQLFWAHALLPEEPNLLSLYSVVSFYRGRYDKADEYIAQALKFGPDNTYVLDNSALINFWKSDYSSALANLDKVIASNPKDTWAFSLRARIHAAKNELADARKDVDAALALDANSARAHFTNGLVLAGEKKSAEAQSEFDKSYALDDTITENLIESGKLAEANKDAKTALAWYDKALAAPIKTDQDKVRQGQVAVARTALQEQVEKPAKLAQLCLAKDFSKSEAACTEALAGLVEKDKRIPLLLAKLYIKPDLADANEVLASDPNNVQGLIERGRIYKSSLTPDLDLALADFNAAIKIDSNNADALLERAKTYLLRHEHEKALADLDTRIALAPTNPDSYFQKAFFLERINDYDTLLAVSEKLTSLVPENAFGWSLMSEAKLHRGDVAGAEDALQKAVAIIPDSKRFLGQKAAVALTKGDATTAAALATMAIEPNQSAIVNKDALLIRSEAYLQLGHAAGALQDSEAVLSVHLMNKEARAVHAEAQLGVGEAAKALVEATQFLSGDANNTNMIMVQAGAYLQLGEGQKALEAANAGLALTPDDARLLVLRGKANLALAQKEAAIADFDQAAKLLPKDGALALLRAQSHFDAGQFDATLAALDGETDSTSALTLTGEALFAKGDKAKALEALEKAIKRDNTNIRALKLTGDIYAALGTNDMAMQFYGKAIDAPASANNANLIEDAKAARGKLIDALAKKTAN